MVDYNVFAVYGVFFVAFISGPSKKWVAALIITRLLNSFVGHPQFFMYTCIAESLTMELLIYHDYKQGEKHGQFIKPYLIITLLGIIGKYIARIYLEVKRRPAFVMRESNIRHQRDDELQNGG